MFEYPTMDVRSADLIDESLGLTTEEVKDILKENDGYYRLPEVSIV